MGDFKNILSNFNFGLRLKTLFVTNLHHWSLIEKIFFDKNNYIKHSSVLRTMMRKKYLRAAFLNSVFHKLPNKTKNNS